MDIERLSSSLQIFRTTLDDHHKLLGSTFRCFPRGCCGDASQLLAAYLKDEGYGMFHYVSGWQRDGGISHAWLEKNALIIDLTADQFGACARKSMITEDHTWHDQFSEHREYQVDGDFRNLGEPVHLSEAFAQLRSLLK